MLKIIFQIYGAILFLGVFCGSLLFGYLSDQFGRKIALIVAILTVTISPAIGAYMPTAAGFGIFRFLLGKNCNNLSHLYIARDYFNSDLKEHEILFFDYHL